jgi:hypothetical protein
MKRITKNTLWDIQTKFFNNNVDELLEGYTYNQLERLIKDNDKLIESNLNSGIPKLQLRFRLTQLKEFKEFLLSGKYKLLPEHRNQKINQILK